MRLLAPALVGCVEVWFPEDQLGHVRELQTLAAQGFAPARILDVGADTGDWAVRVKQLFPAAEVVMIDAVFKPEAQEAAAAIGASYVLALLDAEEREVQFLGVDFRALAALACRARVALFKAGAPARRV